MVEIRKIINHWLTFDRILTGPASWIFNQYIINEAFMVTAPCTKHHLGIIQIQEFRVENDYLIFILLSNLRQCICHHRGEEFCCARTLQHKLPEGGKIRHTHSIHYHINFSADCVMVMFPGVAHRSVLALPICSEEMWLLPSGMETER